METTDGGKPQNGWTFTTLLRYIESLIATSDRLTTEKFIASDRAVQAALAAAEKAVAAAMAAAEKAVNAALVSTEKAVQKAEDAQLRVNVSQDEVRLALKDQTTTLASKEQLDATNARVGLLERGASAAGGKGAITSILWAIGVSILVGMIILLAKIALGQ